MTTRNVGDQIRDAVQNAVTTQDFSNLQHTIERSIGVAADNIGRGLSQASAGIQRAQFEFARDQEQRQHKAQMKALYNGASKDKAIGYALAVGGGIAAVPGVFFSILAFMPGFALFAIPGVAFGAGAAAGLIAGINRVNLAKRFERYRDIITTRTYCAIDELAQRTGKTPAAVSKDLKKMLEMGLFKQASLDDQESMVITTNEAYQQYRNARFDAQQRQQQQRLADSVTPAAAPRAEAPAGADELLARGEAYVAKIRLSNDAIAEPGISRRLDQIEHVVRTIFERAGEHPEVIDDLGKLMDYYLPTTVKLLDAYRDLDAQPIQGENIQKSKREIESALDSLGVAFEKLLDSVFKDVAWDVSTDVSVLHTVLAQEGLVEDPFKKTQP